MTNPPYVCPYCKRELKTEHSLKLHTAVFESGRKCLYPGRKLKKTIPKKVKRKVTKKVRAKKPQKILPFKCSKCPRTFRTQAGLGNHLSRIHGVKFNSIKYQRQRTIKERLLDPEAYPHKCPKCEFRSPSQHGITLHLRHRHPEVIFLRHDIIKRGKKSRGDHHTQYDLETLDWLEERTIKNILIWCNGKYKNLMNNQKRTLRYLGIIYRKDFTQKAFELMEEIRNEKKNPE